jgi:hypothetical protein
MDPTADITDFFFFRSYEAGKDDKALLIMDVIPGEEPSSGPNYYTFDPNVLYAFNIDNDRDGKAFNVRFEFSFTTEVRGVIKDLGLFLGYVALPPVTALDGPGSEGLGLRQKYTVAIVKDGKRTVLGSGLIAVPSNVGPRTMPDYDALTTQGIYDLGNGAKVYAGQRDDPFYIDLGAVFDTLNLRSPGTDMLSGFNVNTIALEVPVAWLTQDGKGPSETAQPLVGAYASTSRMRVNVRDYRDDSLGNRAAIQPDSAILLDSADPEADLEYRERFSGWVHVQRLANPLVNEAIIGTKDKDFWNAVDPDAEELFVDYYENLRLDTALQAVFGAPASPLLNVKDLLLKYDPARQNLSELLRLNVSVAPVPLASQNRLTALAGDNAGWPNGRRPIDDVTDVAIRVIGGTNYATASDGVDANDKPLPDTFPFLASPWDGLNRVHANP